MKLAVEVVDSGDSIWKAPTNFGQGSLIMARSNGRIYMVGRHYEGGRNVTTLIRVDDASGYSSPLVDYSGNGEQFREVKGKLSVER